jgi:hypothetical protein
MGIVICADFSNEKTLSSELLKFKKKYYELKYVKDKVE